MVPMDAYTLQPSTKKSALLEHIKYYAGYKPELRL